MDPKRNDRAVSSWAELAPATASELATGALWSSAERWGAKIASLATLIVLARLVQPAAFGAVALASVVIAAMGLMVDQGLGLALVQRRTVTEDHLAAALWLSFGSGLILATLLFLGAPHVASAVGEPSLAGVLRALAFVLPIAGLASVPSAILQRQLRFRVLAARNLTASVVSGVVAIVLALAGAGVWALVSQALVSIAVATAVLWVVTDIQVPLRFSFRHAKELLGFGVQLILRDLVGLVSRRGDDAVVGGLLGTVALGYYSIGYRLHTVLTDLITGAVADVAVPAFARQQDVPERAGVTLIRLVRLLSIVTFPLFIGVGVLAPLLVPLVFGDTWQPSVPVAQVLAAVGLLQSVTLLQHAMMVSLGRPAWSLAVSTTYAVTNITLFLLVARWGILAVATAYAARAYAFLPLELYLVRRLTGLRLRHYVGQFAVPLAGSLVMSGAALGTRSLTAAWGRVSSLLVILLVAGISYVLAVAVLDRRRLTDLVGLLAAQRRSAALR